jgi:hypothetical protein
MTAWNGNHFKYTKLKPKSTKPAVLDDARPRPCHEMMSAKDQTRNTTEGPEVFLMRFSPMARLTTRTDANAQYYSFTESLPHTVSVERQAFMRNFVEAQMVAYEAKTEGVSSGWLFWSFKMD